MQTFPHCIEIEPMKGKLSPDQSIALKVYIILIKG